MFSSDGQSQQMMLKIQQLVTLLHSEEKTICVVSSTACWDKLAAQHAGTSCHICSMCCCCLSVVVNI